MKKLLALLLCLICALSLCSCADTESAKYTADYEAKLRREGYEQGFKDGYQSGFNDGQIDGYNKGLNAGKSISNKSSTTGSNFFSQYRETVTYDYVLNSNSKKFHYPWCSSVSEMKESNKIAFSGTRDDAIAKGYSPCKRCNP